MSLLQWLEQSHSYAMAVVDRRPRMPLLRVVGVEAQMFRRIGLRRSFYGSSKGSARPSPSPAHRVRH